MSSFFGVDVRERWAARSMIVKRWLVTKTFDPKEPICELEVDGVSRLINGQHSRFAPGDFGWIYRFFVAEGNEIDPAGHLFEFSDTGQLNMGGGPAPLHGNAKLRLTRRDKYPRVFLNYRMDDADAYAGRLHEVLAREFGADEVFMSEFSIRSGEVWGWTIQQAVVHASIVIALVGRQWLTIKDEHGRRRIDYEHDYVRREIVAAMDRGTVVMPVLLPDASIPKSTDFACDDELTFLPQLQFHRITGARHWTSDVTDLITAIKEHIG